MPDELSTIAKRKKIAALVSELATDTLGIPVTLTPDELTPGEFSWRLENFETKRGKVSWLHLDVCRRGINVHSKFAAPQFAPIGANEFSGKWNHYIWPDGETPFADIVQMELPLRLAQLVPTGATRQDRPDMMEYWAAQRAEFATQCAART